VDLVLEELAQNRDCQEFRVRGGERSLIRPVLW
jgi:hypothetical protein